MMHALHTAIKNALAQGSIKEVNKAYLEFIKANFIVPIEQDSEPEPRVLFLAEQEHLFLPVFTEMQFLERWADSIQNDIKLLKLSGVDLLKGLGEQVYVCLDIGTEHYKEFNPSELARMRSMVLKLFKN